jgi:hypothetical protein
MKTLRSALYCVVAFLGAHVPNLFGAAHLNPPDTGIKSPSPVIVAALSLRQAVDDLAKSPLERELMVSFLVVRGKLLEEEHGLRITWRLADQTPIARMVEYYQAEAIRSLRELRRACDSALTSCEKLGDSPKKRNIEIAAAALCRAIERCAIELNAQRP